MSAQRDEVVLAFLLGRALAGSLGVSNAIANQWASILAAFGLSGPGVLIVYELARRDAAADAAAVTAAASAAAAERAAVESALDRMARAVDELSKRIP